MSPLPYARRAARQPRPRQRQRGVAMIVALVMLVVIGFTSVAVMRGAMSADAVAHNARVQSFAMQAAQVALRYCERQLTLGVSDRDPNFTAYSAPVSPAAYEWESYASWHTGSGRKAMALPAGVVVTADSSAANVKSPECLAQQRAGTPTNWWVVTARGFSPDYSADSDGRTTSGSVVWLQSTLSVN